MRATRRELYDAHCRNVARVQKALDAIGRGLRHAISSSDASAEIALTRVYTVVLSTWAEVRLWKLLFEEDAFTWRERAEIAGTDVLGQKRSHQKRPPHAPPAQRSQTDKWRLIVLFAFRKHYGGDERASEGGHANDRPVERRDQLLSLFDQHLAEIVTGRNKLAHGQWEVLLNGACSNLLKQTNCQVLAENVLSLQYKRRMLHHMAELVHALVVSKPSFEEDFFPHYFAVEDCCRRISKGGFGDYRQSMIEQFLRGKKRRRVNSGEGRDD